MNRNNAIITVNLLRRGTAHDLDVPLDISANELCAALFQKYLPEQHGDMKQYYLKAERPIVLLRGERTLREYGIRKMSRSHRSAMSQNSRNNVHLSHRSGSERKKTSANTRS